MFFCGGLISTDLEFPSGYDLTKLTDSLAMPVFLGKKRCAIELASSWNKLANVAAESYFA
jgi:hypothetical protein